MLLTIDIGNTNITLGIYADDKLLFVSRLASDKSKTSDQYAMDLHNILLIHNIDAKDITGSIISSVVPVLKTAFRDAVKLITNSAPLLMSKKMVTNLNVMIDEPAQLGEDRIVSAVAAISKYAPPCIIYDMGTATTIDVIDRKSNYVGGVILAGPGISRDALAKRTAALPHVSLTAPEKAIGKNTVECMQSGLVFGAAAMIDGMTDRILEELGESCATLIATGGLAREIVKHSKYNITYSSNLLLDGLKIIYNRNKNKS